MRSYLQAFRAKLDFQANDDTLVGVVILTVCSLLGFTFIATLVGFIVLNNNLDFWLLILRCYTVFSIVLIALAYINYRNRR